MKNKHCIVRAELGINESLQPLRERPDEAADGKGG